MTDNQNMIAFGPVPSRRLGRSLGINNIPPKHCTYSCVYCQLGRTGKITGRRQPFYKPETITASVNDKIKKAIGKNEHIDYLSFVPDGEPTLDANLGKVIDSLKNTGIKIAVITNSSLIWDSDVCSELLGADWVSLKIDAVTDEMWHRINRPLRSLSIDKILGGIIDFRKQFKGKLVTETMLIKNINDDVIELQKISEFIKSINPEISYISIPIRPPAEKRADAPDEHTINAAYQIFNEKLEKVECLIGYEGSSFAFTGDAAGDILSITSVHPMREDGIVEFLSKADADWSIIDKLIEEGMLLRTDYKNQKYFMRKIHGADAGGDAH